MIKPNKIIVAGDIHFFNHKRFDEHKHVLNNFYKIIKKEKPNLIVLCGDIIDSKLRLSPEQIEICRNFLLELANFCPVIMIPGNHDLSLQNKERLDSLTPIVNSLINETKYSITYLKESGLYKLYNITWAVWSCIDDQKSPFDNDYIKDNNDYIIGLYHGVVNGAYNEDGFKFSGGIEINEFKHCNQVFLSDIHCQQSFRNNEINYTGSLIQVSVNENPEGSCLLYNYNNNDYDLNIIRIKNDYSTINLNADDIINLSPINTQKVRLKFDSEKTSRIQALEIAKEIKLKHNIKVDLVPIIKKKDYSVTKLNSDLSIDTHNINDYFNEFVIKSKDKIGISNLSKDLPILLEYEKRVYNNISVKYANNPDYDLTSVEPGAFRATDYSFAEWTQLLSSSYLTWANQNNVDIFTNNTVSNDLFSFNYAAGNDRLFGNNVPGYWRGIYQYFYDTDRPHTHPWEMLGYVQKPSWWNFRYGPAPYSSENKLLWSDLELGFIYNGSPSSSYINPSYSRPGLSKIIPVDIHGNLLPPMQSVIANYDANTATGVWTIGDQSPQETAWRRSSAFPFAKQLAWFLARPAQYCALKYNTRDIQFNKKLNQ